MGRLYEFLKNCGQSQKDNFLGKSVEAGRHFEKNILADFFGIVEQMAENGENVLAFSFSKKEKGMLDLVKLVSEDEELVRRGYWRFIMF